MNARTLRFFVPFAISAALLYFIIRSVAAEPGQVIATFFAADWRLIAPAIALYFVGIWLRSSRWGLLLPQHMVTPSTLFPPLWVGFTVTTPLPPPISEFAPTYPLNPRCPTP